MTIEQSSHGFECLFTGCGDKFNFFEFLLSLGR